MLKGSDRQKSRPGDAKTFDKKAYRIKKYSHKYKVEKWEENRKKEVLKSYYKELKNDPDRGKYQPFDFDKHSDELPKDDDIDDGESTVAPECSKQQTVNYVMHPRLLDTMKRNNKVGDASQSSDSKKIQPFWKVKQEMQRIKEEKIKKKEEYLESKKQKEEALKVYREKKASRFQKLSKKNRKGQPLMKERMNLLLERIQKTV